MINIIFWCALFPFLFKSWVSYTSLDIIQAICAHFTPFSLLLIELFSNCIIIHDYKPLICVITVLIFYLIMNIVYSVGISINNYLDI